MLKTNQAKSAAAGRIHLSLEKRIWDQEVTGTWSTREGETILLLSPGDREDVNELAELVSRRANFKIESWTDLGDECWHDLVGGEDEVEVGSNQTQSLYIAGPTEALEYIVDRLRLTNSSTQLSET